MNFWGESEHLSPGEEALRILFVDEYVKDFDEVLAAMRCGFTRNLAETWSNKFMNESFVIKLIHEKSLQKPDDELEQEEVDKQLVLRTLREAAQRGPFATRVASASKLAAIYGMDKPVTQSLDITNRGGVMAVPGISNLDEWEAEAIAKQEQLIKEAQD